MLLTEPIRLLFLWLIFHLAPALNVDTDFNILDWSQKGETILSGEDRDEFGSALRLSYDCRILAIRATSFTRVYERVNSIWQRKGSDILLLPTLISDYGAGFAMNRDGTMFAVGEPTYGTTAADEIGRVRVFEWSDVNSDWIQKGSSMYGVTAFDLGGSTLSMNGDGLVMTATSPGFDGAGGVNTGRACVYAWSTAAGDWQLRGAALEGPTTASGLRLSVSMNLDGSQLALGTRFDDTGGYEKGSVRVYLWTNASTTSSSSSEYHWIQQGETLYPVNSSYSSFGDSVFLSESGLVLAVSMTDGQDVGHVYTFEWQPNTTTSTSTSTSTTSSSETSHHGRWV